MKIVHKTYKFRLEPNESQQVLLDKHLGSVRWVYNHFLNERKNEYFENKKTLGYYHQCKTLTQLKEDNETDWLREINSQSLQQSLRCLDTAYSNFFKGKARFPRYKSKKNTNGFVVPQRVKMKNGRLCIPKFKEGIRVKVHRIIDGEIKYCTITKTSSSKYFVSMTCKVEHEQIIKTGKAVGLDLGLKDLVITSDGTKFPNLRYSEQCAGKLKKAQRRLSKKKKGSRNYEKQKLKVAKVHEKIINSRKDMLHKTSNNIVNEYDIVSVENLDIHQMMSERMFARSIGDASWRRFIGFVKYKIDWNDKTMIEISRFFPSSKTCSKCGWINQNLELRERKWKCYDCGALHDRDINASINILNEGLKVLSSGTGDYTCGGDLINKLPMKQGACLTSSSH